MLLKNNNISVSIVKKLYYILVYFFQFIINQNLYQIWCMCQHKPILKKEIFIFQKIYAKHFNLENRIKSMFATIFNKCCIIQCKIQIFCLVNSQKLITVYIFENFKLWHTLLKLQISTWSNFHVCLIEKNGSFYLKNWKS